MKSTRGKYPGEYYGNHNNPCVDLPCPRCGKVRQVQIDNHPLKQLTERLCKPCYLDDFKHWRVAKRNEPYAYRAGKLQRA